MDELLPVVDKTGKVIGKEYRSVLHKSPDLIHPVVHAWIFNKKGQVLLQQRSLQKDTSPGYWDMSCGGHIKYKDTPIKTLERELQEELGIMSYKYIYRLIEKYVFSSQKQSELIYLYYVVIKDEMPASQFTLQKSEVEQVQWMNYEEILEKALNNEIKVTRWVFTQLPKIYRKTFVDCIIKEHKIV